MRPAGGPTRAQRSRRRSPERAAAYVLVGPAIAVDPAASALVVAVQAGGCPGPFAGRRVEVHLAGRLRADDTDGDGHVTVADLRPGDRVAVRVRLARRAARLAPRVVHAARIDVLRRAGEADGPA